MNKYEPIIGLEIHIELGTKSKMFCSCSADYFQKDPNTHTCPVCLGLPGAMPVANELAIIYTQMLGLALGCSTPLSSKFDRKNYFYPDLTKGFQISQYDLPFTENGVIKIESSTGKKKIGITRAHLEEDTGKLLHTTVNGKSATLIDFNRSGVPLVEIVTEPDMNSSEEAKAYAQKLQQIARYLEISDADMEKGSMRIEPNVSLRKKEEKGLPQYKVELKNINSFNFAQRAIEFEIKRQSEILDRAEVPIQETRGWNEQKNETVSQRSKEEAHDYRYFPEPDLPPFSFNSKSLENLQKQLPELPDKKQERFKKNFGLSTYDAKILASDKKTALFYEEAAKVAKSHNVSPKEIANFLINKKVEIKNLLPAQLVLNVKKSKTKTAIGPGILKNAVRDVLIENQKAAQDYQRGKTQVMMFLIGMVMRKIKANVDTEIVKKEIQSQLRTHVKHH